MEKLKEAFFSYTKTLDDNALSIIGVATAVNLFVDYGVGWLFLVALVGFGVHFLYEKYI